MKYKGELNRRIKFVCVAMCSLMSIRTRDLLISGRLATKRLSLLIVQCFSLFVVFKEVRLEGSNFTLMFKYCSNLPWF